MSERSRKTLEVQPIVASLDDKLDPNGTYGKLLEVWVEGLVAEGHTPQQIVRFFIISHLEMLLMRSNNYHGFRFTDGYQGDMDSSRRHYYGIADI